MNDQDQQLQKMLSRAQKQVDAVTPPFVSSFAAAEQSLQSASRRRYFGLGATAAIMAVSVGLIFKAPNEMAYVDVDAFMNTTHWVAPSDALLPARQFDIYHEVPRLIESTEPLDGALL
ncbi:MAG: hypothetical protein K0U72_14270 [Gammaproteobacteria bacterium]|nr:hypothetical protein [Gammaproteobacteria bacterium]